MIAIPMQIAVDKVLIPFAVEVDAEIPVEIGVDYVMTNAEEYEGEVHITPSETTQTLQTTDRIVRDNIIIDPIPENYGRLAWVAGSLTVY